MPWPPSITIDHASASVTISSPPDTTKSTPTTAAAHINAVLQQAVDAAIENDVFPILSRTHSEPFRILGVTTTVPEGLVQVERFASPLFGIATRGAHMTCYVRDGDVVSSIWVARRSRALHSYPGKLDSTVAGGIKAPDSPRACILAEAMEEASLPSDLVHARARATGVLTLANRNPRSGLFHGEVLYVYDMELPSGVTPTPGDDEVEAFELMSVDEVRRRMEDGEFKPNVCAVMTDFFVRHGFVTPESEGEGAYVEICDRLRRRLPMPTSSVEL
jgi:isopentenyldiphosphate isomerase